MTSRNMTFARAACVAVALCGFGAMRAQAAALPASLAALDPDKDGSVSLDEAKAAADKKFEALDTDHDGTLDAKEAGQVLHRSDFSKADPDKDGTMDKAEWSALVDQRFKAADTDHDGTLDARELASPAGKSLLRLVQ
jgi:Ca2+-binding EF-hand superfamily protein